MPTKLKAVLLALAAVLIAVGVWFIFRPRAAPTPPADTSPTPSLSVSYSPPGSVAPPTVTPSDTIVLPVMSFPPTQEVTPAPTPTPITEQVFFDYFGARLILTGVRSSEKYPLILDLRCENSGAYEMAIGVLPDGVTLNGQPTKLAQVSDIPVNRESVWTGEIAFENLVGEALPDISEIREISLTFLLTDMFEMKTLFETVPRTVQVKAK
jgi:hypothetical protein